MPAARTTCLNCSPGLGTCGKQVDGEGRHALKRPNGGGTVARHHAFRDAFLRWLKVCGVEGHREQEIA
eukprot:11191148-Lingulodinium_polyedra.AAC.1